MEIPRNWRHQRERYRLEGSNCQECGEKHFPRRDVCPDCGAIGVLFDSKNLSLNGEIILQNTQKLNEQVAG